MPFISRSLLVAVHAAAFSALLVTPLAPVAALASPMPMPFPLITANYHSANRTTAYPKSTMRNKDATRKSTRIKHAAAAAARSDTAAANISRRVGRVAVVKKLLKTSSNGRRAQTNSADSSNAYDQLNGYYNAASTHSKNLQSLAAQSSSVQDDDSGDFQQQAASELTSFHTSLLGLDTILQQLGADKGLLNDDRTDELETLLKKVVNLNKDTLSYITTIVYNLPILGPTLGPIIYELKCILDEILDACENLADAIINVLKPLLEPLIGKFLSTACNNGVGLPTCLLG